MNLSNRLRAIEAAMRGKPPELRPVKELTDRELWTVLRAGHPELPADLDQVSDEALAALAGTAGG